MWQMLLFPPFFLSLKESLFVPEKSITFVLETMTQNKSARAYTRTHTHRHTRTHTHLWVTNPLFCWDPVLIIFLVFFSLSLVSVALYLPPAYSSSPDCPDFLHLRYSTPPVPHQVHSTPCIYSILCSRAFVCLIVVGGFCGLHRSWCWIIHELPAKDILIVLWIINLPLTSWLSTSCKSWKHPRLHFCGSDLIQHVSHSWQRCILAHCHWIQICKPIVFQRSVTIKYLRVFFHTTRGRQRFPDLIYLQKTSTICLEMWLQIMVNAAEGPKECDQT